MADPVFRPTEPLPDDQPEGPLFKRLGWFVGIAIISMLAVAAVAYLLRTLLFL
ncbi:MAG: DUF2474 family protein [Alphaproteobacteria bacterium]|uniref:DUF2474 domain-containing protein n=1 Tax=Hyphomonas oceanitis SCH89 TaxID=1280953 RepID=A0A059G8D1_9PROT|nr:DUF2474 family protein [Hyphomonas oceanitis]MBU1286872.1 DUF2474 family protein [Alphaproteobacteria bacterium]KDA02964.1 hypothetical protein HOC_07304 [Hyphomonas oceanitis SCH89]MBU2083382.1 DUF2474 family protein [Alphaproteobacteria bacterium]MBU2143653.1 DUF2474 family protein [Alphaproteobacteria bacterium]MBU2195666.1 DUF2474 family protein [Alphaproteobacteria bacterium]|tara:strand:- start:6034 stop:6192 length:159 start_codon:yes stop_codon:yes gene_type:complete